MQIAGTSAVAATSAVTVTTAVAVTSAVVVTSAVAVTTAGRCSHRSHITRLLVSPPFQGAALQANSYTSVATTTAVATATVVATGRGDGPHWATDVDVQIAFFSAATTAFLVHLR